jgi:hypothetical protein
MSKQEKKISDLTLKLSNNNSKIISDAIEALRKEKTFYGAIGLLTTTYDESADPLVRKQIKDFMNDLKDPAVKEEIIAELKKPFKDNTLGMLVSSCWQSGLDYSGYAIEMAAIFINGSYITALECFTVLEESLHNINREEKDKIIELIKKNTGAETTDKTVLTRELLKLLE